jgi:hypothetical protein
MKLPRILEASTTFHLEADAVERALAAAQDAGRALPTADGGDNAAHE